MTKYNIVTKIFRVLSRKIYIPRHITLEWHALDTLPEKKKLEAKELSNDYVSFDFMYPVVRSNTYLMSIKLIKVFIIE